MRLLFGCVPLFLLLVLVQAAAGQACRRIAIDTDRSVNCATLKTIVADVCRDCKGDQQKAVALYNFFVRTCWMSWHSHRPLELVTDGPHAGKMLFANDPMKYITVYGYLGCGPQAGVLSSLMEAAGIESRMLDPGFGHVSCEFKWDGKWHWLDPWLPAYVLDHDGAIPSYDDIMADRKLFTDARKEGRAPGNFLVNASDESCIVNAKNWKHGPRDPYPQKYVEDLALRPGESATWLWDNLGTWYNPAGPYIDRHLVGQYPAGPCTKFGNDAVLKDAFGYWEPYRKTIPNGSHPWSDTYYRYYGNAVFIHEPPLTAAGLAAFGAEVRDLQPSADGLTLTKPPAGEVVLRFDLPYVIADTRIEGRATMGVGGAISFCFSVDGGKTWLLGGEVKDGGPFQVALGRPNTYEFPFGSTSGRYGFLLRLVFRTNSAKTPTVLGQLKVTNVTMLNFYSRPWLEVGRNEVTVTAEQDASLKDAPLEITWRWLEDWTAEKSFTHRVAASGEKATIEVGGTKRPKMKSITIARPAK